MVQVQADKSQGLLTLHFKGRVPAGEAETGFQEVQNLLPNMAPNFRLLTDLSGLEVMDHACVPHIEKVMDLCRAKGLRDVVRIIPDPHKDIGFNIMSLFHYGRKIPITTCATWEEANRFCGNKPVMAPWLSA